MNERLSQVCVESVESVESCLRADESSELTSEGLKELTSDSIIKSSLLVLREGSTKATVFSGVFFAFVNRWSVEGSLTDVGLALELKSGPSGIATAPAGDFVTDSSAVGNGFVCMVTTVVGSVDVGTAFGDKGLDSFGLTSGEEGTTNGAGGGGGGPAFGTTFFSFVTFEVI